MRTLFLILLLTTMGSAQDLSWLTGHWTGDGSEEVWSEPRDGNLMGFNRQFKDGELIFFEHLRIEKKPDRVVYQACPGGRDWTTFDLAEHTSNEAVFVNPNHDFPQKIHYQRKQDKLLVTISGAGRDSVSWTFRLR